GTVRGDEAQSLSMNRIVIDFDFMQTYDIPLLEGRALSREISGDILLDEDETEVNVIINELAAARLGFASAADAINKNFYDFPKEREVRVYTIVGVMPDQNFLGLHNKIKPIVFEVSPTDFYSGSIRISGRDMKTTIEKIEKVWDGVIPEYPIQTKFLDETFEQIFVIFSTMTQVLTGFSFIALMLSMIGLFGLAAFMAARRTKEIGIRKVMGANLVQIVRMLIWQFSRPVMWALLVALPVSYFASNIYLDFFADRLNQTEAIVSGAGILVVCISWAVVAVHAVKIARSSPIYALRYE
ncbi:MAG: FtsX-like permease family protein, partial [Desulfobacterales bacterium]